MRPVTISDDSVRLECGIQMEATIPLSDIEKVCFSENDICGLAKADKLNYGTFYRANVWVVTKQSIAVRTMLGEKQAQAIGLSLDDPRTFARTIQESTRA